MDFPGNSHLDADKVKAGVPVEKPEVVKVVTSPVTQKKKTLGARFKGVLFDGAFKGAVTYVALEVVMPAVKNMIFDTLTKGSERVIFGNSPRQRTSGYEAPRSRVTYNTPVNRGYSGGRAMLPDQPPHAARRQEATNVVLTTKADADEVLKLMIELLDRYGQVTLADFNELCGLPSAHTDNKWGWTDLLYVGVQQDRSGYYIDLPPMGPL